MTKFKLAMAVAFLLIALAYVFSKSRNDVSVARKASDAKEPQTENPRSVAPAERPSPTPTKAPDIVLSPVAAAALSDIFANDDVCALERYIGRKREDKDAQTFQAEAEAVYFASSAFSESFTDYTLAISGMPGANSYHGRFLSYLRMANWIEHEAKWNGLVDVPRAIDDLARLALEDSGNAAPAAFALALAKSIGKPTEDLTAILRASNRFDSYQLNYLRSMADFDDPSTTSFLMRMSHHATLAIPNWGKFKTEFVRATEQDLELRYLVTDLMMKEAKETKQPSSELGFNVLQTAMARAIAGSGRVYPNFKEIDAAFPQTHQENPAKFVGLLADASNNTCDPARVQKLRDYVRELHARNSRGGLAF